MRSLLLSLIASVAITNVHAGRAAHGHLHRRLHAKHLDIHEFEAQTLQARDSSEAINSSEVEGPISPTADLESIAHDQLLLKPRLIDESKTEIPDAELVIRASSQSPKVPTISLQQIQQYLTSYNIWVAAWVSQNKQYAQAVLAAYSPFQAETSQWVDQATHGSLSTADVPTFKIYIDSYTKQINAFVASKPFDVAAAQLQVQLSAFLGWVNDWYAHLPAPVSISSGNGAGSVGPVAPAPIPSKAKGFSSNTASFTHQTPAPPKQPSHGPSSQPIRITKASTQPMLKASATPVSPPAGTSGSGSGAGSGSTSFNAQSRSNLAVYWGASPWAHQVRLPQICSDSNVNIVVLAFLTDYGSDYASPSINIGNGDCSTLSSSDPGCLALAQDIKTCQNSGKKVLLSVGGASGGGVGFSSESQAQTVASTLWNYFGAGSPASASSRPFGSIVLDGFDIDTENNRPAHIDTLVFSLRNYMNKDTSKQYFISAAPQCPIPDASIPLNAMQAMDFVWVQFYNNPGCNVGSSGFSASAQQWSSQLKTSNGGPKLYIGSPACPECAGSGYNTPDSMKFAVHAATSGLSNSGGMMLWDGSGGKLNSANGADYLAAAKQAVS